MLKIGLLANFLLVCTYAVVCVHVCARKRECLPPRIQVSAWPLDPDLDPSPL